MRKLGIIFATLLTIIILFLMIFSSVIFQEGNPIPVASGVFSITVLGQPIVQINDKPETYMVKASNRNGADAPFMDLKKQQGYVFKNRGIGPYYEGNDRYYRFEFRMVTRGYMVIEVHEMDYASYPLHF